MYLLGGPVGRQAVGGQENRREDTSPLREEGTPVIADVLILAAKGSHHAKSSESPWWLLIAAPAWIALFAWKGRHFKLSNYTHKRWWWTNCWVCGGDGWAKIHEVGGHGGLIKPCESRDSDTQTPGDGPSLGGKWKFRRKALTEREVAGYVYDEKPPDGTRPGRRKGR
jgi:hypothetical protein